MLDSDRPGPVIRSHTLRRPAGLIECKSVLDVGAGIRPMQWYRPQTHICIEPFGPYADVLEDAGMTVIPARATAALQALRAEAVYMLDVIEHMDKKEGQWALDLAVKAASRQVVVFTPVGFHEQLTDAWGMGGDYWQMHKSGWLPAEFQAPWRTELVEDGGFFAVLDL